MKIHLYVDGPRDEAAIPPILGTLLGEEVEVDQSSPRAWSRLNQAKGYRAKVRFALTKARNAGVDALVAVCDADRQPKRIEELKAGREEHRARNVPFPAALGQANPHGEAWLLDDPTAIRQAWRLHPKTAIPTVRNCGNNPKKAIEELFGKTGRHDPTEALGEIAANLDPKRCPHADRTGFGEFVQEVLTELGPCRRAVSQDGPEGRG